MGLSTLMRGAVTSGIAAACLLATMAGTGQAIAASAASTAKPAGAALPLSSAQLRADQGLHELAGAATSASLPGTSGGSIIGRVQSAAGAALTGICVTAYGPAGPKSAVTRQNGQFVMTGLRPGRYQLQYRGCNPARPYLPEWYGDAFDRTQSSSVVVSGLRLQALHPVTLYPAGASLGQLSGIAADPQDGANQMAADPFGRLTVNPVSPAELARSLAARAGRPAAVTPAAVVASKAGRISGKVASPSGQGLAGICVIVVPTGNSGSFGFTTTGKAGKYSVGRLSAGRYELIFYAQCGNTGNWLTQVYKNKYSFNNPTAVPVKAGKTTASVNAVLRPGGEISGTVTGPGGRKLSDICAYPLQNINPFSNSEPLPIFSAVSENGAYHIRGLPAGSYQIGFSPCGNANFAPVLWPGTQNYNAAATITLLPRELVTNIDEIMQFGGTIEGTVTSAADPSKSLSGICVEVVQVNGLGDSGIAVTNKAGAYVIKGLDAGRYEVDAFTGCGNNGNYVGASFAHNLTVTNGGIRSGIDVALPTGAIISGTVTSAQTSGPLAGICVQVDEEDFPLADVVTKANGSYSVNQLPADTYQVQFSGGCGNSGSYAPQGYDNTSVVFPQDIKAATAQVITGIDAALQPGPAIAGRVTNSAGRGLAGICVVAITPGGIGYGEAVTSAGGRYDLANLAPGLYQVGFGPGCGSNADLAVQWFRSQSSEGTAALVSANSGTVRGIDAALPPASGISGTLKTKSGRTLEFACVDVAGVSGAARSLQAQVFFVGSKYEITGMPLGAYQVVFQPNCVGGNLENQWYKDKPSPAHATDVKVVAGHIHAHIDGAVVAGGAISGEVTYGGQPVANMCVLAQNVTQVFDYGFAVSNAKGHYVIPGLNSGQYELEESPCSNKTNIFATEIVPRLARVTAPKDTVNVNISAALGGNIKGSVTAGSPATVQAGVCVEALQVNGPNGGIGGTGTNGKYNITNLPAGQYKLYLGDPLCSADPPDLAPVWYPDSQTEITAASVTVTGGAKTTAATTTLSTDGSIAGVVSGPGSKPLAGICVAATPPGAGQIPQYAVTAGNGSYQIDDVVPGQYQVQFSSGCGAAGYLTQWWHGAKSRQGAALVDVQTATTATGISAAMHK